MVTERNDKSDEKLEDYFSEKGGETGSAGEPPAAPVSSGTEEDRLAGELFDLIVRHFCLGHSVCLKTLIENFERNLIEHVLNENHWNQRKTAQILGVKYTTLNHKVFKLGLHVSREDVAHWRLAHPGIHQASG